MKASPAAERLGKILGGVVLNSDWAYQARQVAVTPQMARRLLQGAANEFQRGPDIKAVAQTAVKRYAHDMLRGTWRHSTITVGLVSGQDAFWLINGKHRLHAVVAAGDKQLYISVVFGFEILLCESVEDLKANALAADIGQSRTSADLIQISGLTLDGLDRAQIVKLQSTINTLIHGFGKDASGGAHRIPQETYEAAVIDWAPTYRQWRDAIGADRAALGSKDRRQLAEALSQPSVVAMGLVTIRAKPSEAHRFWSGVADGEKEAWIGAAAELLREKAGKLSLDSLLRSLGIAWSNHVREKPLETIKPLRDSVRIDGEDVPIQRIPIFLAGTVWDGLDFHYYSPTGRPISPSQEGQRLIGFNARYSRDLTDVNPVPRFIVEKRQAAEARRRAESEAAEMARRKAIEAERARLEAAKADERKRIEEINSMGLEPLIKSLKKLGWSREDLEQMSIAQFRSIAINQTRPSNKSAKAKPPRKGTVAPPSETVH